MSDKILDGMKKLEELKKKRLMAKVLTEVKKLAKEVQENKKLCEFYLQQIVEDPKEQKAIIDWINNLEDVMPDADRIEELQDKAKNLAKEEKKQMERKMNENPEDFIQKWQNQNYAELATTSRTNAVNLVGALGKQQAYLSNTAQGINIQ